MSIYSECNDFELVQGLKRGECEAFKEIFSRYHQKLLYYTISIVKSQSVGKDIVQETFLKVWEKRQQLNPGQSLSAYVHVIARNMAFNHLKRAGYDDDLREKILESIMEKRQWVSYEEELHAREHSKWVERAIVQLPPRRELIFRLSRENKMTHREIANKLGISKNTVKNQIVSAQKQIREFLKCHTDIALSFMLSAILFLL